MSKIAAVINNYNYAAFVAESIESVLNQTILPDEIIVIDDGSTDDSLRLIRQFGDKIRLISKPNQGQLSCFYKALEASDADYFFLLDADDAWAADHVETAIEAFRSEMDPDCVFANCELFGSDIGEHPLNKVNCEVFLERSRELTLSGLLFVGMPTSACAFKTCVIRKVLAHFQDTVEEFRTCADDALVYGTSLLGNSKLFTGKSTTLYRTHESNCFFNSRRSPEARKKSAKRRGLIIEKLIFKRPNQTEAVEKALEEYVSNSNTELYNSFYKRGLKNMEISRIHYEITKLRFILSQFKMKR